MKEENTQMKNKVLVAMGIGIFAALTFNAASVTTLADDGTKPEGNNEENNEQNQAVTVAGVIATNAEANDLADQAVSSITGADGTEVAETKLEAAAEAVYGENDEVNPDNGKNPEDFYKDTTKKDSDILSGELDSDGNKETDVKESLNAVGVALGNMQSAEKLANTSADNANQAAKDGNKIVADVNDLVKKAETEGLSADAFSSEEAIIEQAAQTLEGDCTKDEADAALAAANQAVEDVNKKIDDENKRINDIESQIIQLEGQYNDKSSTYNTNVESYNGAVGTFYDQKSVASTNAQNAETELGSLDSEATALLNTTNTALTGYNKMVEGYIEIGGQETLLKDNSKRDLPDYRRLVYYIMKDYYVPDVLGGTMVDQGYDAFNKGWNTIQGEHFKYTDESGTEIERTKGDVLRSGVVTYIDKNEEKHTILINYKTNNGNDLKSPDYSGIVIFAKTAHSYGPAAENEITDTIKKKIEADGSYLDNTTGLTYIKNESGEYQKIMLRNDNWYSGDTLLVDYFDNTKKAYTKTITYTTDGKEGTDSSVTDNNQTGDFRNKVDNYKKVSDAYDTLSKRADTSEKKIAAAKGKVVDLEKEIAKLECNRDIDKLNELKWNLGIAKANLAKLEAERDEIIKKRDEIEKKYDDKFNPPADTPTTPDSEPDVVTDSPLIVVDDVTVDAPADVTPVVAAAPVGAVLGANRPVEATTLGSVRSGSVLGERRGPQNAVLGKRRSPKTADGAMGGMVAGMMLSMMSAFGGAKVLKKKDEE